MTYRDLPQWFLSPFITQDIRPISAQRPPARRPAWRVRCCYDKSPGCRNKSFRGWNLTWFAMRKPEKWVLPTFAMCVGEQEQNGGFLKWGYLQIIYLKMIFHELDHPAIGVPTWLWTPLKSVSSNHQDNHNFRCLTKPGGAGPTKLQATSVGKLAGAQSEPDSIEVREKGNS